MKRIIDILFSPGLATGIGLAVVGILYSLKIEAGATINNICCNNRGILIGIVFIYVCISFAIDYLIEPLKNKIMVLENALEEKDRQLSETHGIVYHRYGEFARFSRELNFEEALRQFVDKYTIVNSAQIYRVTRNKENNRILITLNHIKGYCKNGFDINSILQTTYVLNYEVYKTFRRDVWRKWKMLRDDNLKSWEWLELYEDVSAGSKKIVEKICKRFSKIDRVGIVEDNDFSYYRLLSILELILTGTDNVIIFDNVTGKEEIDKCLRRGKRTGVLGSILLEDIFVFSHKGESKKNGRMYVSFYFEDKGVPYVTIFSFTPKNLSERLAFKEEVISLVESFKLVLDERR